MEIPQALNQTVSQIIEAQRHPLAEAIVARLYAGQAEAWEGSEDTRWDKSVRDTNYHLSFLGEALAAGDPSLFTHYVAWVKVLFAGLNFPDEALVRTLECTQEVFQEMLPEETQSLACAYVEEGLQLLPRAPAELPSFLREEAPLFALVQAYLEALLRGARQEASRLILDAVAGGVDVKEIYLHVFQVSQYEIGRLWQMNRVTVAQEHYCTAATQLIMSQLYPYIFATERVGSQLVMACVGQELHEIGARMVADFFEMEGWDTYYLGANVPTESIVATLAERRVDLLGLSVTMTYHVKTVADLIVKIRASEVAPSIKILVGGYPFAADPELWRKLGADGCARDAPEAVTVAARLRPEETAP